MELLFQRLSSTVSARSVSVLGQILGRTHSKLRHYNGGRFVKSKLGISSNFGNGLTNRKNLLFLYILILHGNFKSNVAIICDLEYNICNSGRAVMGIISAKGARNTQCNESGCVDIKPFLKWAGGKG